MSNTVLDALGVSQEAFEEAKAAPSTGSFLWDSGAYKVDIVEAAIFSTDSGATMFKLTLKDPEADKTLTEYANTSYTAKSDDKDGAYKKGDKVENKSGAKLFKSLLSALHLEPTALSISDGKTEAYGKEVDAKIIDLAGRGVIALVRQVDDSANNEKYGESNVIEGFADIEGNIDDSPEPLKKWLAKIEKAPVLVKKAKKSSGVKETSEETKKAAAAILDI